MSKKLEELEGQLSDAGSEIATLREFLDSSGWKWLDRQLHEQVELRKNTIVFSQLEHDMLTLKQEYMKGEASGLGLARALAQTHLELLQLQHKTLNESVEAEREKEAAGDAAVESRLEPRVES